LVDVERDMESLKYENSSLKLKIEQYNQDRKKHDSVLREIMNEKAETENRMLEQLQHMKEMEEEV